MGFQPPHCQKCQPGTFASRASIGRLAIIFGVLSLVALRAASVPAPTREYEVKAAALYNIIAFTDWPESAFKSPDAPLVVAVFGRGLILNALADLVQNEAWRGRQIVIERNPLVADAKSAHVVFISRTEQARWPFIRGQLAGKPVLIVSDADDFARDGGTVQFTIERNKLRLVVNLTAARAAQLQISSRVLRLAEVIGTATD
jgi:hypothetical protein